MYKTLTVACISLLISGCQLDPTINYTTDSADTCSPLADKIDHWLTLESQYQLSEKSDRAAILALVREHNDTAILALLLSQPESNTQQLKESLALFGSLELDDEPECHAEQFLQVRYRYTQSVMALQRAINQADLERKQLSREKKKLQLQVEALTKIERDLSIQKEGEEK